MLVFSSILAPCWDVYSDWAVAFQLYLHGDTLFAIATMIPPMTNMIFLFSIWKKLEVKAARRWSWILVLSQCWPQVYAARIVWMIVTGQKSVELEICWETFVFVWP